MSYSVGDVEFELETSSAGDVLDVRALRFNDHDPKPLQYQLEATWSGQSIWEYVERGPGAWRVRIARIP